jgi:Delta7-sterol 5-desaturase
MLTVHLSEVPGLPGLLLLVLAVTAVIAVRYGVIAGGALLIISQRSQRLANRRIQPQPFTRAQLLRELLYSLSTSVIFASAIILVFGLNQKQQFTQIYPTIESHGWLWFWMSIPTAIALHDFYFYWAHRAMHLPGVYERVHKVHHLSTNPSPLAALAFHPTEAVVEIAGFLLIATFLPMHPTAILIWAMIAQVTNAMGHLGYELFPKNFAASPAGQILNTATSHNQHHRTFAYNFGLYSVVWDRLFGTLHPNYGALFKRVTGSPPGTPQILEPNSRTET